MDFYFLVDMILYTVYFAIRASLLSHKISYQEDSCFGHVIAPNSMMNYRTIKLSLFLEIQLCVTDQKTDEQTERRRERPMHGRTQPLTDIQERIQKHETKYRVVNKKVNTWHFQHQGDYLE